MTTNTVACAYCGEPVDGRYREVTCWEEVRTQGGANRMIGREPTGRQACGACVSLMRQGIYPNTPRLL